MPPAGMPPYANPRGMILAIVILLLVILGTGILFYQSQEGQVKERVTRDLTAIQTLKGDQIAAWRQDRLYDARVLASSAFFIEGVDHYLTYGDDESKNTILRRLREMNTSPYYDNIVLVDSNGTVRMSLDPSVTSIQPPVMYLVNTSLRSGTVALTDFYRVPGSPHASLDVIAPLIVNQRGKNEPVGAVLLSINPDGFLYPLIQAWPVSSGSAETLLVEREGDHVLYLNELRHQNNTALNLTIPLTQVDLPAVRAVLGTTGAFTGKDYRGVDVIAVLGQVPGSPWYMVAKVDTAEAYSSWQSLSALIIILVAITLGGAVIIVGLLWQRRQKYYYRSLYAVEAERTREELRNRERLEILLHLAEMESAGEQELADFVLDAGCRLTESPAAFIGRLSPDETVFETAVWSKPEKKDSPSPRMTRFLPCEKAGIWAEAVRKRTPVIMNSHAAPPKKERVPREYDPVTRFVSVPIFEGQRIVMVFTVANRETGYRAVDMDNLTLLAQGVWNHLRKRAADELLRQKSTDLEAAFEEITATDEELRANYEDLAGLQNALAESERKHRILYHYAQVGLFEMSVKDATVVACNQRYADLAGFASVEEAIGKDISGLYVNPEDRTDVDRILREQGSIENHLVQFRNLRTGRIFWAQISARFNYEREVAEGSIIDITEQKEAEAALRESEEQFRTAFEDAALAMSLTAMDGRLLKVNHAFCILLGYSEEQMLGMTIRDITLPEEISQTNQLMADTIAGKTRSFRLEKRYVRKDGSLVQALVTSMLLRDPHGEPRYFITHIQDITEHRRAEETIKKSETRYRRLFESAKDGILILNRDTGEIIDANPFIETLLGYAPRDLLGKHLWDIGLFKDQPLSRVAFEELQVKEYLRYDDLPLETLDGQRKEVEFVSNVYSLDAKTSVIQCNIRDITDRKRADEALRETNEYLNNLFDYANAPIIVWDPQFRITRFNHAFETLTGRTDQDVLGRNLDILFPDVSREASLEHIRKTGSGERWETVEIPILHISGEVRIVLWNSANIVDPRGTLVSTIAQGYDITDRKAALDALRESEEKYRVLFTRMVEGSALHEIVYDPAGNPADYRILDVNPAFESVLGIRREDVVGKTSREAYGVDTPPFLDTYAQAAATGQPAMFEEYFAPMGKYFSISVFSPKKGRFATVFEDITDRKQAEEFRERLIKELEQKNAELERFTYTVSHDLKSPLITIKGFAGLLEDDTVKKDPVQLKKDVQRIITAADTMQELLADVLELSRIGRVVFPPEKTPFGTIAKEAVDLLAGPLAERGVWIEVAPDFPVVRVDHARIREALVNLVENAVKFMGSQQNPVIRIGVETDGTTPVFFVQDNGIGIDP
ncbi:MAG: PAS domain S-box protein, partial [Methanoregulaceae archaeon]